MIEDRLRGPWKHTPTGLIVRAEGVLIAPAAEPPADTSLVRLGGQEGPPMPIVTRARAAAQRTGRRQRR